MSELILCRFSSSKKCTLLIYDDKILDKVKGALEAVKNQDKFDNSWGWTVIHSYKWLDFSYTCKSVTDDPTGACVEVAVSFEKELSDQDKEGFFSDMRENLCRQGIPVSEDKAGVNSVNFRFVKRCQS